MSLTIVDILVYRIGVEDCFFERVEVKVAYCSSFKICLINGSYGTLLAGEESMSSAR